MEIVLSAALVTALFVIVVLLAQNMKLRQELKARPDLQVMKVLQAEANQAQKKAEGLQREMQKVLSSPTSYVLDVNKAVDATEVMNILAEVVEMGDGIAGLEPHVIAIMMGLGYDEYPAHLQQYYYSNASKLALFRSKLPSKSLSKLIGGD